jgi:hypothetical protein
MSMKARTVSFFIDSQLLPEVLRAVDEEILPRYRSLPHFVGLVVLESNVEGRPEVIGLSVWDEELEDSEAVIDEFVQRLYDLTGISATRKVYRVVRLATGDATLV